MRSIFLLAVWIGFCAGATAQAAELSRPSLITESFFAPRSLQGDFDRRSWGGSNSGEEAHKLWYKALLGMGLPSPAPGIGGYSGCGGWDTALVTLRSIRAEKAAKDYEILWAKNQLRVFSACEGSNAEETPPEQPTETTLPERAQSDFLYQRASWYFYRQKYEDALADYRKAAADKDAPMRPQAAYMVARTLHYMNEDDEAYETLGAMLADPSLASVHAIAANYRFVMGYGGSYPQNDASYSFAEKHLRWLLSVVQTPPEKMADIEHGVQDYFDAMEQLDMYFPYSDRNGGSISWWLEEREGKFPPRMQAVKQLAPTEEIVDWMQAKWAANVFDTDWLWALHDPQSPYWVQNDTIVTHAWKRWKNGDGLEWLQIAARRARPQDALSAEILRDAAPYFTREWKNESLEYRLWLLDLWTHALRLHLGRGDYDAALALVKDHADFMALLNGLVPYAQERDILIAPLSNALRWLVYTGQSEQARAMLEAARGLYPQHFRQWRVLLATDWQETVAAMEDRPYGESRTEQADSTALFYEMLNRVSRKTLYELAGNEKLLGSERSLLARAAFARALLLNDTEIDRYALLATKLNPSVRESVLNAVEQHDPMKYIDLFLEIPRLRPLPYLAFQHQDYSRPEDMRAIDTFNHSINNWWCRVDDAELQERVVQVAAMFPVLRNEYGSRSVFNVWGQGSAYRELPREFFENSLPGRPEDEFQSYLKHLQTLLEQHPYLEKVDTDELVALEAIPNGSQYLSEAVIAQEEKAPWWAFWRTRANPEQQARRLHEAVRTTRYGCQRNGSHATYSKAAFTLLHKRHAGSIWAKATPYWFGCSHFYHGCPADSPFSP